MALSPFLGERLVALVLQQVGEDPHAAECAFVGFAPFVDDDHLIVEFCHGTFSLYQPRCSEFESFNVPFPSQRIALGKGVAIEVLI
jgi:hypothetical protein